MEKTTFSSTFLLCAFAVTLLLYAPGLTGQETGNPSPALPDNVNKIVSVSCVPCHTDKGGLMSKAKLNFSNWTNYSTEKQKEKADLIRSMLEKDKMPPKAAREKRPEIVPTNEQKNIIIKWAESMKTK
jgi:hypothetical protein